MCHLFFVICHLFKTLATRHSPEKEDQLEAFVLIVAEVLSELLGQVATLTNPRIQVFHSIASGLMEAALIMDSKEAKAFLTLLISRLTTNAACTMSGHFLDATTWNISYNTSALLKVRPNSRLLHLARRLHNLQYFLPYP